MFAGLVLCGSGCSTLVSAQPPVQFIYTSDLHFGIQTKGSFQGSSGPVASVVVNRQAVRAMNRLPALSAPPDHGVQAGQPFGNFDFLAITGDIANRQEVGPPAVQSATASWTQFQNTYGEGLTLHNKEGRALPLFLTPGNHDVSNAIGYPEPLNPATDATAMVQVYNAAYPAAPISTASFAYRKHKVFYSKDFGGIHFVFLNLWPDSDMRARIDADIQALPAPASTPVVLLLHMPPRQEAKNFTDPVSAGSSFVFSNGFQNLLVDQAPAGLRGPKGKRAAAFTAQAVQELAGFIQAHRTIVAWFHGHENGNAFTRWDGGGDKPSGPALALPVFQVDSPLKGLTSSLDERRLSFQVVSIDPEAKLMTVRECLWNSTGVAGGPITWGESATLSLQVPRR